MNIPALIALAAVAGCAAVGIYAIAEWVWRMVRWGRHDRRPSQLRPILLDVVGLGPNRVVASDEHIVVHIVPRRVVDARAEGWV